MDLYEAIHNNRCHKLYRPDMPVREVLERVIEAALWAPSGMNLQPWEVTVMTGKTRDEFVALLRQTIDASEKAKQLDAQFFKDLGGAPMVIAVTILNYPADPTNMVSIQSGAALMQNLLLAAHAEGLGTCWVTEGNFVEKELLAFLGKTDRQLLAITPIGYPAEESPLPPTKPKVRWLGFD